MRSYSGTGSRCTALGGMRVSGKVDMLGPTRLDTPAPAQRTFQRGEVPSPRPPLAISGLEVPSPVHSEKAQKLCLQETRLPSPGDSVEETQGFTDACAKFQDGNGESEPDIPPRSGVPWGLMLPKLPVPAICSFTHKNSRGSHLESTPPLLPPEGRCVSPSQGW